MASSQPKSVSAPEIPEETRREMSDAERLLEQCEAATVESDDDYQRAADYLSAVKGKAKSLEEQRRAITRPIDDAKKRVMDMFKPPLQYLSKAEAILKRSMAAYVEQQRQRRLEEQRKAEAAAQRERDRKAALARKAEERGDAERARQHQEAAEAAEHAPVVSAAQPKAAGTSVRQIWKHEVVDLDALIQAVAEGKTPKRFLQPADSELRKLAGALQGDAEVPGVRFYAETSVASRSRS